MQTELDMSWEWEWCWGRSRASERANRKHTLAIEFEFVVLVLAPALSLPSRSPASTKKKDTKQIAKIQWIDIQPKCATIYNCHFQNVQFQFERNKNINSWSVCGVFSFTNWDNLIYMRTVFFVVVWFVLFLLLCTQNSSAESNKYNEKRA